MRKRRKKIMDSEEYKKNQEKYQFMQEQIQPQPRHFLVRYLQRAFGVIVLAVLFGIVAGITFNLVNDKMAEKRRVRTRTTWLQNSVNAQENQRDEEGSGNGFEEGFGQDDWKQSASVGKQSNRYIVQIQIKSRAGWVREKEQLKYIQSGAIIRETSSYYYVLTAKESLFEAKDMELKFYSGETAEAELRGQDPLLGIAVLRVEKEKLSQKTREEIRVAELPTQSDFELGEPVLAVGSPGGVMRSVIQGAIINDELVGEITDGEVSLYSLDIEYCQEGSGFIADEQGKLVGMITNSFTGVTGETDAAFLDIAEIQPLLRHLIRGRDIAYLGIKGSDYNKEETLQGEGGVYITSVIPQSPAYKGELRVADVIVSLDGHKIADLKELRKCLLTYRPGDKIKMVVDRGTKDGYIERELRVTLQ